MEKYEIPSREGHNHGPRQYLATNILRKTIELVPNDAYCMLTITMQDLYPGPKWAYCFGWAMYKARTGVFSFLRFDTQYKYTDEYLAENEVKSSLLYNSCHVMVHETGHMYGMTHCTHYECTMNGFNSAEELEFMVKYLCPICLRKLQSVIGFNVRERFVKLHEVCQELGFTESAQFYEKMLNLT
jgi:archaemetzincin